MTPHSELDDFAHRARDQSWRRQLDAAAAEVFDAFDESGVEARLLKGPVLARLLYDRAEERPYSDVDVLIAPGRLDDARHALASIGYDNISDQFNRAVAAELPQAVHAEAWARATESGHGRSVMVDVHWWLRGCEADPSEAWPQLTEGGLSIEMAGRRVSTLNAEGLAVHLAAHAAQHGPENRKAIEDLVRGIERWELERWEGAAQLAERVGATPTFAAGLRLVAEGAALADALELPTADQLTWAILHRDEQPRGRFHLDAVAGARGLRSRTRLARGALMPTREWIVTNYPWAARGVLWRGAARVMHLMRAPVWALRAWRFRRRESRGAR